MSNTECLPFVGFNLSLLDQQPSIDIETYLANPIERFDKTELKTILTKLTDVLKSNLVSSSTYPFAKERITLPLTLVEIATFLEQTAYLPSDVITYLSITDNNTTLPAKCDEVVKSFNNFIRKNIGSGLNAGGICGSMADPIIKAMSLVENLVGAIQPISDLVNMKNVNPQLPGQVMSQVKQLQSLAENFAKQQLTTVQNLQKQAASMVNKNMAGALLAQCSQLTEFLKTDNVKAIKNNIERVASTMVGQFKDPLQADNLQLMLFRLCQMGNSLESFIGNPVQGAIDMMNNMKLSEAYYKSQSEAMLQIAKAVGINIPSYEERINEQRNVIAGYQGPYGAGYDGQGNVQQNSTNNYPGVVPLDDITPEEQQWVANRKANQVKSDQYVTFVGGAASGMWPNSLLMLQDDIFVRMRRAAILIGKSVQCTSAYRSPAYNASVGGARNSNHMKGLAMDILLPGGDAECAKFVEAASRVGIERIAAYPSFFHCDVGSGKRNATSTWQSLTRATGPLTRDALGMHLMGAYKAATGTTPVQQAVRPAGPVGTLPIAQKPVSQDLLNQVNRDVLGLDPTDYDSTLG